MLAARIPAAAAAHAAARERQAARGSVPSSSARPSRTADAQRASFCPDRALASRRSAHARASSRFAAAASSETFSVPPPPPMVASTPEERKRLWMAAIKPPIYSVSIIPTAVRVQRVSGSTQLPREHGRLSASFAFLATHFTYSACCKRMPRSLLSCNVHARALQVGFAAAFFDTGIFSLGRFMLAVVSGILVIMWLNFSNDAWVRVARPFRAASVVGKAHSAPCCRSIVPRWTSSPQSYGYSSVQTDPSLYPDREWHLHLQGWCGQGPLNDGKLTRSS